MSAARFLLFAALASSLLFPAAASDSPDSAALLAFKSWADNSGSLAGWANPSDPPRHQARPPTAVPLMSEAQGREGLAEAADSHVRAHVGEPVQVLAVLEEPEVELGRRVVDID
ncbi:hypothetical protein ACJRO7_026430 [Eucalyptus globulus]|uniref:Uncharacterized protein n=1 Tax=Eucalyptus globulus TaxID=34317 RepID=A0ABD3JU56_EUCGL